MASNDIAERTGARATPSDPLSAIVAGCRRGELAAQRELVLRTQDRLYRMLVRLVGLQDAEDVAQQVYVRVFQQATQFKGESAFSTWLYRLAVNEALQHLRRARRRRQLPLDWDPTDGAAGGPQRCEARDLLDRALAEIEPNLRAIFVLREVEGLSYEAIGAAVELPAGTVASRLSRARHELQQRLRRLGWTA